MNEQSKFKELVLFLAENTECGNIVLDEEITRFEDAIEKSGCGEAYFGIAKLNWEEIEVIKPEYIPSIYKRDGVKYYAEYYDGMQAPFTVCKWNDDYNKLEELLKNTSDILYGMYQELINYKPNLIRKSEDGISYEENRKN